MTDKAKLLPGYFSSRPRMPAVAELRDTLGLQSSIVQTIEIAIHFFEEKGHATGKGFSSFLTDQAGRCGLAIGLKDFRVAKQSISKWYIAQIFQVCDSFLKSLIIEYREFKRIEIGNWKTKRGNENLSRLEQLLANFPKANANSLVTKPEYHLLEYYRLVRNWVVHPTKETEKMAKEAFAVMDAKYKAHFEKCYAAAHAPNTPSDINFDDALLFCRSMMCFSHVVNDACNLTKEDIEPIFASKFRHILPNPTRKETRVKESAGSYFNWHHGGDKVLRKEFASFVAEKFRKGDYFK
jgi:hypothetical protein